MSEHDYPANEGQDPSSAAEGSEGQTAETSAEAEDASSQDLKGDPDKEDAGVQIGELNDRLLRMAAELENTRRRAEREKADAGKYAIATFARDLLGVADNFSRALQAAGVQGDTVPEGHSEAFNGLVAGIQMTEKELLKALQRHGVEKVFPAGEKFDPNLHQAVANIPSPDIPKGHVVDVAQPGFTIGERVLRAAMVTVSSGAPAGGPEPGAQVDEEA
ncbi:MAG: nucleotide exchange factor GrpE [Pseudomonadota bacterium]